MNCQEGELGEESRGGKKQKHGSIRACQTALSQYLAECHGGLRPGAAALLRKLEEFEKCGLTRFGPPSFRFGLLAGSCLRRYVPGQMRRSRDGELVEHSLQFFRLRERLAG